MNSLVSTNKVYAPDNSPYIFNGDESTNSMELFHKYFPLPNSISKYSVPIPGTEVEGYSPVYRNKCFPNGLKEAPMAHLNTYPRLMDQTIKYNGDSPVFGYRKYDYENEILAPDYSYINYQEMNKMKNNLSSGLLYLLKNSPYKIESLSSHQKIDNHEREYKNYCDTNTSFIVTLYAANRWEWVLTDLATSSYSLTNTALYDTLGPESSSYILKLTESPVVICSKNHIKSLIDLKQQNDLQDLILIISMDPILPKDGNLQKLAADNNIQLFQFDQVMKFGEIVPLKPTEPSPDTLYTISFTSGTTGSHPKGVQLSQRICTAGITFTLATIPHKPGVRSFSFLPLAHIFEREVVAFILVCGGCIGFPQLGGSPLTLVEDLKVYKPDLMANVPRVFTKFEGAIKAGTIDSPSSLKRKIFEHIFNYKLAAQASKDGEEGRHLIYDSLFIKKLRSVLGFDNMSYIITGSAPISPATIKFLKASLNTGMAQGYGLTESFAGFAISQPYEKAPGTCGSTAITVEMKVRELPSMGYFLNDPNGPKGELLLRGPQVFSAYFKNKEETDKCISEDGWFSTGDVANISPEGKLSIIDRVKNFLKLAQGEYVTPEKVENQYLSTNSNIIQCYCHGDSLKSFLVGIIGIEKPKVIAYLTERGIPASKLSNDEDILSEINKPAIRQEILNSMNKNMVNLQGFERLHNIFIEFEPLTLQRNVVTPTMKLKRPIAAKFFAKQINDMYEEGSLIKKGKL